MNSEETYKGNSKSARSLVLSRLKADMSDLEHPEQVLLFAEEDTQSPLKEAKYAGKGAIRRLERMFAANEDEI